MGIRFLYKKIVEATVSGGARENAAPGTALGVFKA
jgi:hypothetical protein